jgi:hypothetical protein
VKYLPLVWAGLWRKPLGTTFCPITIAFLLFGMVRAIHSAFDHNVADANLDRLYVWNRINLTEPLPIAYLRAGEDPWRRRCNSCDLDRYVLSGRKECRVFNGEHIPIF